MDNFVKITTGYVRQYFEPDDSGTFVCTGQEFIAGDVVEYIDDCERYVNDIDTQIHQYQTFDMIQPGPRITPEILAAIERGKDKVKRIEAKFRKNDAWLDAIYDVVNRTGLAIRNEIECIED